VTRYESGRRFEWAVKRVLEREGWFVVRSAGSHSPADLVALRNGHPPLVVQCRKDGRLGRDDFQTLQALAVRTGSRAVLAKRNGRGIAFQDVNPCEGGERAWSK